jgi:hypothetical protein
MYASADGRGSLCCQLGLQLFPVPGQKFAEPIYRVTFGHAVDDVGKIGFRIEAIKFCCFKNGIKSGGLFTTRF